MKASKTLIRKAWPRIRIVTDADGSYYQVDARRKGTNGKQKRVPDRAEAEALAAQIAADYQREGREGLELSSELRVFAVKADKLLAPYGKSVLEAAEFYKEHLDAVITKQNSRLVSELAEEWYQEKKAGGKRKLRQTTLTSIYNSSEYLRKNFGDKRILELSQNDLEKTLDALDVKLRRKFNLNSLSSQFFNWCIHKKYCSDNPASRIEVTPDPRGSISILTPAKAEAFMSLCEAKFQSLTLYHAICLFAGLRPFECQQLQWEDIHLVERVIHIRPEITKVKESRNVPIEENLAAWLTEHKRERTGFVTAQKNFTNLLRKFRAALGYRIGKANKDAQPYPQDVTRHSYASYWLERRKDRANLAENMGNSLEMIKRHYKQTVSVGAAQAYWEISPTAVVEAMKQSKINEEQSVEAIRQLFQSAN